MLYMFGSIVRYNDWPEEEGMLIERVGVNDTPVRCAVEPGLSAT